LNFLAILTRDIGVLICISKRVRTCRKKKKKKKKKNQNIVPIRLAFHVVSSQGPFWTLALHESAFHAGTRGPRFMNRSATGHARGSYEALIIQLQKWGQRIAESRLLIAGSSILVNSTIRFWISGDPYGLSSKCSATRFITPSPNLPPPPPPPPPPHDLVTRPNMTYGYSGRGSFCCADEVR